MERKYRVIQHSAKFRSMLIRIITIFHIVRYMKNTHKRLLGLAGLSLIVLLFSKYFGPLLSPEYDKATPIMIGVSQTPLSAPFIVADKLNLFETKGLNVEIVPCTSGVACAEDLLESKTDYATASETVVMFQSFENPGTRLLASFVESDNDVKLLSLRPLKINRISDLEGRRVGIVKASASEFYFDSLLIAENLLDMPVERIYLNPSELVPALLSFQVDAISTWEPYGYLTNLRSTQEVVNLGFKGIYQLTFNLISHTNPSEEQDMEAKKILEVLNEANHWIHQNPEHAMSLLAEVLNVQVHQIRWSWEDYVFRLSIGNSLLTNLQLQSRWAIERGLTHDRTPDFRQIIDRRPLEALKRQKELQ